MILRLPVALICTVLLLGACAGTSGPKPSEGVTFKVSGQAISVIEFSLDGVNVRYNAPYEDFGVKLAVEIAKELREKGHNAEAVRASEAPAGEIIVSGRILRISNGSSALRFFFGHYGAGPVKFGVSGTVKNSQGKELATFEEERWATGGMFGGHAVKLVNKCLRAVGTDVAQMLNTGHYRTADE